MNMRKKIVFLSGTRADFGKLKSLMLEVSHCDEFEVHVFATGMHMNPKYGRTVEEIVKAGIPNIFRFYNHQDCWGMDQILARTIDGFSSYVRDVKPDMIVLHGDRVEALAGAIVGSMNNILTAHIEGGELSGTIDESIRHAVSKLSHVHLVANDAAKQRLVQMGERPDQIHPIGSADIDLMFSSHLPSISFVKQYYEIAFDKYGILIFHPVTTEVDKIPMQSKNIVDAVLESGRNYIVVYPNNDEGSAFIFHEYQRFKDNPKFRIFPSIRFEYFLVMLKQAQFILGNSSCAIMEAPYYGIPSIDIGSRQQDRTDNPNIFHCGFDKAEILAAVTQAGEQKLEPIEPFGGGKTAEKFMGLLKSDKIGETPLQKKFLDTIK